MGRYSIKDLERLSGIKAHTIRIWEKRYGVIVPERSDTNIRTYCDTDLKRLLNIAILNNNGFKISRIATLQQEELHEKVREVCETHCNYTSEIDRLIVCMVDIDELKFEKILSDNILRYGFEDTILEIIYPFLVKIGVMWQTGSINPAQEHFMSNLIRQKLIVAIDGLLPTPAGQSKVFTVFLPEGELHELGMLFYNYVIRKNGHTVVYLGQSVPLLDVQQVAHIRKADYLVTTVTYLGLEKQKEVLKRMSKDLGEFEILINIPDNSDLDDVLTDKMTPIVSTKQFMEHIAAV